MRKFFPLGSVAVSATLSFVPSVISAQELAIDHALARQYFAEAKAISDKDNGPTAHCGTSLWTLRSANKLSPKCTPSATL